VEVVALVWVRARSDERKSKESKESKERRRARRGRKSNEGRGRGSERKEEQ
jgi:hypothetical protein